MLVGIQTLKAVALAIVLLKLSSSNTLKLLCNIIFGFALCLDHDECDKQAGYRTCYGEQKEDFWPHCRL